MAEQAEQQCRIIVIASSKASNFQALIDAVASGRIPNARIVRLIVNRARVRATERADRHGIPWEYFNLVAHGFRAAATAESGQDPVAAVQRARDTYDAALADKVLNEGGEVARRPDLIVLAGWMHILGDRFLEPIAAAGIRIINLHPALPGMSPFLPPFP